LLLSFAFADAVPIDETAIRNAIAQARTLRWYMTFHISYSKQHQMQSARRKMAI